MYWKGLFISSWSPLPTCSLVKIQRQFINGCHILFLCQFYNQFQSKINSGFYICGLLFSASAVNSPVTQCDLQCYLKNLLRIYFRNIILYYCTLFNRIMVYLKRKAGLGKTNQARNFTCLILVILPINLMKIKKLEHVLLHLS